MKNVFYFQDQYYPFTYTDHVRNVVRAVVVNSENKIALLHVVSDDNFGHRDCYELPGGGKKKEESFHEGVLREVREETGFNGKIMRFIAKVVDYYNYIHRENHNYYYVVKVTDFVGLEREDYEKRVIQELLFVDIDEAIRLMSNVNDDGVGHLIKQRELPILKLAKEYIKK